MSVPSTGQLALDLMCGEWGASRCSPTKWFKYMGDAENNAYVPFQINYVAQNGSQPVNGYIPLDPRVTPCNESLDVNINESINFILFSLTNNFIIRLKRQLVHVWIVKHHVQDHHLYLQFRSHFQ